MLRERFGVSERRACRVVKLNRSTQRLPAPVPADDDADLRAFLRDLSRKRPRWGWRRAAKQARREGRHVNDKRVRRLWREEGLRVPAKRRKKRLSGIGVHVGAMCPIRPNVLWALDFKFDTTADGRTLKMRNVIDEFTRECLAIVVDRSIDADAVVAALERLAVERGGSPVYVRFDNGPEFVAHAVADWCRFTGTGSVFIDPGSPWQDAAPHRPRRPHPRRVRHQVDHHQPTEGRKPLDHQPGPPQSRDSRMSCGGVSRVRCRRPGAG
jgi:putative transposase